MKSAKQLTSKLAFLGFVIVIAACFSAFPHPAAAQSQGNNAIYYQPGSKEGSGALSTRASSPVPRSAQRSTASSMQPLHLLS